MTTVVKKDNPGRKLERCPADIASGARIAAAGWIRIVSRGPMRAFRPDCLDLLVHFRYVVFVLRLPSVQTCRLRAKLCANTLNPTKFPREMPRQLLGQPLMLVNDPP